MRKVIIAVGCLLFLAVGVGLYVRDFQQMKTHKPALKYQSPEYLKDITPQEREQLKQERDARLKENREQYEAANAPASKKNIAKHDATSP